MELSHTHVTHKIVIHGYYQTYPATSSQALDLEI